MDPVSSETAPDTARVTDRSRVRRFAPRGSCDRDVVNGILDECLIAYVGFQHEGHPAGRPEEMSDKANKFEALHRFIERVYPRGGKRSARRARRR